MGLIALLDLVVVVAIDDARELDITEGPRCPLAVGEVGLVVGPVLGEGLDLVVQQEALEALLDLALELTQVIDTTAMLSLGVYHGLDLTVEQNVALSDSL